MFFQDDSPNGNGGKTFAIRAFCFRMKYVFMLSAACYVMDENSMERFPLLNRTDYTRGWISLSSRVCSDMQPHEMACSACCAEQANA